MCSAVEVLKRSKESFRVAFGLEKTSDNFIRCVEHDSETVVPLLHAIAKYGFVRIQDYADNDVIEMIVKNNLGVLIADTSTHVGLPNTIWHNGTEQYALVASSESSRLQIAHRLLIKEEKEKLLRSWNIWSRVQWISPFRSARLRK